MNLHKLWLVARTTYLSQVQSRYFIILTLVLPLVVVVASALPALLEGRSQQAVVGLIDLTGQLDLSSAGSAETEVRLLPFAGVDEAEAALAAGDLSGFLVIQPDYLASGRLTYYGDSAPNEALASDLAAGLRRALAPDAPAWLQQRLDEPALWRYEDLETGRSLNAGLELAIWTLTPAVLGILFVYTLMSTLSYTGPSIVREKEERAMEMVLTSLRPVELVGGKLCGIALLTATQVGVWLLAAAVAVGRLWVNEGSGGFPSIPWNALLWAGLLCAPGYLLYSGASAVLGIIAGSREQARQTTSLLTLLAVAPIWILSAILTQPNGSLAVTLSLLPPFAPILLLFRMGLTAVPAWQLWVALGLLWLSVAATMEIVAKLFRTSALLYGETLRPREILRALRSAGQKGANA